MNFFHTADWHLGKLVQGYYMTEDQRFVINQLVDAIKEEKPDAVIISGDLYDRAVPPTEAVDLLNEVLEKIVIDLRTPVLAIAGNHDSPDRVHFGNKMMQSQGLHIIGQLTSEPLPVVLNDEHGEVHVHLVPYAEPSRVRHVFDDQNIRTHDDAMRVITQRIVERMDQSARHIFVGHAFVTASGEQEDNTSDSERPLAIGGAEHVHSKYLKPFSYTALGHLHKAHRAGGETIRYAGSPLKYSVSEENHEKGFYAVHMNAEGIATIEKRLLRPRRDMRVVEAKLEEIEQQSISEDYVFIRLLDENPVLFPMERVRSVYPNAMHVERKISVHFEREETNNVQRSKMDDLSLFKTFYKEVKGKELSGEKEELFRGVLEEILHKGSERAK